MHFIQILLLLALAAASTGYDCNDFIIPREEWGAVAPRKDDIKSSAGRVFVHHTNTRECITDDECMSSVKEFEAFHREILGDEDLDVHFLIGGNGLIYEGLGWDAQGLHTPEFPNDFGVAFIGTFNDSPANELMMNAFEDLIECGIENGKIDVFHSLYGHKDARCSTMCPGAHLYNQLKQLKPSFHRGGKLIKSCDL
uniref:Peptidoglycan recognition protein family domain-containing protein n=1 Tax=Strigamia maritima TaxID=126957 RepID=T1JM29_STRMM